VRAVLERDFLSEASRTRAVVLRTLLAAVVSATVVVMLFTWPQEYGMDADVFGATLFRGGSVAVLLLLAMLTPPLVVGSVLAERQNDTLPLVLATPVGPRSFAAAKLLSRWWVSLLVAFAALPCLALTTLFGGVAWIQVVGLVVTCLALSLEMAAFALWLSSVSRRLATAVVLAFLLPVARWILAGVCMDGLGPGVNPFECWASATLGATSPIGAFMEMMDPGGFSGGTGLGGAGNYSGAGRVLLEQPWWAYLAFSVLAAGAAVAAAGARLRSEAEPRESLISRTKRGRRWFRGGPAGRNPVLWKEARLLNTASSRPLYYGVIAGMILLFVLCIDAVKRDHQILGVVAGMVTLIAFVAAVSGAASMGHERTSGGYDLLRASLLTPGQIVHGKYAGVLAGLGLLAVVPLATGATGILCGSVSLPTFLGMVLSVVLLPASWAAAGMWCGVRSARPRTAIVRICAVFALLLIGFPFLGLMLALNRHGNNDLAEFLAVATPPATVWGFLEGFRTWSERMGPGSGYGPSSSDTFIGAGLVWTCSFTVLGILMTLLLPRFLAKRLEEDRDGC
jgi:ABC-type transport system involved in multi-copper enzyme maturation permease subunit